MTDAEYMRAARRVAELLSIGEQILTIEEQAELNALMRAMKRYEREHGW